MSESPRKISQFHLTKLLHEGEKSEIYEARYAHSGGAVHGAALKLLKPRLACIGDELRAFLRELNWARDLRSSVLPRVIEAGEQSGNYFLAMELVDGWTLTEIMAALAAGQKTLPSQVGLTMVHSLAKGAGQIHDFAEDGSRQGVVHLGIEPGNIMLRKTGTMVLLDFGTTRSSASEDLAELGDTVGPYHAPEHLRMLPVDPRADVYSLARILADLATLMAPAELGDDLPALIARASHVHVEERFASMADFAEALELVAQNRGFEVSEAACQRFFAELFGRDDKRTDPRARRPQSVAPFVMQSEGVQTAFAPTLDPDSVDPSTDPEFDDEATAVGADDSMATVMGGPDAQNQSSADLMATVPGGQDGLATVMGGPDEGITEPRGDRPDSADQLSPDDEPTEHSAVVPTPESAGKPASKRKFVDQHQAVTVLGAPEMLADMAVSEETTVVVSQESLAAGRFPEELIPTKNNADPDEPDSD